MRAKLLSLAFCIFWSAGIAFAQSTTPPPTTPPGISVVDHKWLKVKNHVMNDARTPTFDDPQVDENTGQVKPPNNNSNLSRGPGDLVSPDLVLKSGRPWEGNYNYFYWLKIQNASERKIRSMAYYYVFVDPASKNEMRRYALHTFLEIAPKQTKWVWSGPGDNPPQMVSVAGLEKGRRSAFDERVEITCVLFTDGTGWKSPNTSQETCDELVEMTRKPRPNRGRIDPGNP